MDISIAMMKDDLPAEDEIHTRLNTVFDLIEECGFDRKSRIWRKADLLTTLVELDFALHTLETVLQPVEVVEKLSAFFDQVERGGLNQHEIVGTYRKAALQASNDRVNRVRRGVIFQDILQSKPPATIQDDLRSLHLL